MKNRHDGLKFKPNRKKIILKIIYKDALKKHDETSPLTINETIKICNGNRRNGAVDQLGLRIGNKNTKTYSQALDCFNKNVMEAFVNNENTSDYIIKEYSQEIITIAKLDKKNQWNMKISSHGKNVVKSIHPVQRWI